MRKGQCDLQAAAGGGHEAGEFLQIERVGQGAYAEEDVAPVLPEVALAHGPIEDRHHAGDARSAGHAQDVLAFLGMEGGAAERAEHGELRTRGIAAEQPVGELAAGQLLDDQSQPVGAALPVDHGVRSAPGNSRRLQHHELAGLEGYGRREGQVEIHYVVHQPAHVLDAGGAVRGQRLGRGVGGDLGGDAQGAVALGA